LRDLDLGCSHAGPRLSAELATTLPRTNVCELHVNGNDLGSGAATDLAKAVASARRLVVLSVACNTLGDEGIVILFREGVAKAIRLTTLDVRGNGFTDKGLSAIADVVSIHPALGTLLLSNNPFGDTGAQSIVVALQANESLTSIALEGTLCTKLKIAQVLALATSNQTAHEAANAAALSTPITRWSVEEVASWLRGVHRRPDLADTMRKLTVNGPRIVSYTARAMRRDGIDDPLDRDFLISAVADAVRITV
jgi:hypothetical protein